MNVDATGAAALLLLAAGLGLVVVVSAWLSARRKGGAGGGGGKDGAGASSPHPHLLMPGPSPKTGRDPIPAWAAWVGGLTALLVLVAGVIAIRPHLGQQTERVATVPRTQPVRTVSTAAPVVLDTTPFGDTLGVVAPSDSGIGLPFAGAAPVGALDDAERLTLEGVVREGTPTSPDRGAAEPTPDPPTPREPAPETAGNAETERTTAQTREAGVAVRSNTMTAGGLLTCRLGGGAIRCWGAAPAMGRSGEGEAPLRAIRAGLFDVCGVGADGSVRCWSSQPNRPGFGTGPMSLPSPAIDVAVGAEHACALSSDGAVYCWGSNDRGQLGGGNLLERSTDPVQVGGLPAVTGLSAGWHHTCAATGDGRAYCWGAGDAGQLGDGGSEDRGRPVRVGGPGGYTRLTAGSSHTCGLTRNGDAWCWGSNGRGQLGIGDAGGAPGPARVNADAEFVSLSAGGTHTCGLTAGGQAWCWGGNTYGQLGIGTLEDAAAPLPVSAGPLRFAELAAGGAHSCGRSPQGGVYCWGNNLNGQLGDGTRDNRLEPVEVR